MKRFGVGCCVLLVGCASTPASGTWTKGACRCEILADHTLLYVETTEVVQKRFSYGKAQPDRTVPKRVLYVGHAELGSRPTSLKVPIHPVEIQGGPTRDLQLEWNPQGRELKVGNEVWLAQPAPVLTKEERSILGWWKRERISCWMLLTPGGTMLEVGSQLRTNQNSMVDYTSWKYLVGVWDNYELFRGSLRWKDPNPELNLLSSPTKLDVAYRLQGDQLIFLNESYGRVKEDFQLTWDKDGHPQIP